MIPLYTLTHRRNSWLVLMLSAASCLAFALYLQHVQHYSPCSLCVYERIALLAIIAGGLLGYVNPSSVWTRPLAFLCWGMGSIQGFFLSSGHLQQRLHTEEFYGCGALEGFPIWMKLDEWVPWLFFPSGQCDDPLWLWMGLDLVQWTTMLFIVYSCAFLLFVSAILARIIQQRFVYTHK